MPQLRGNEPTLGLNTPLTIRLGNATDCTIQHLSKGKHHSVRLTTFPNRTVPVRSSFDGF
jgi:hypothetical protein